jgi:hypothetical protein
MMSKFGLSGIAASLFGLVFTASPVTAGGCGYYGCGGEAAFVEPQPYVYQSCSCCGCGATSYYYYGGYAPAYVSPPNYGYSGYRGGFYGGYGGGYYRTIYSGGPYRRAIHRAYGW